MLSSNILVLTLLDSTYWKQVIQVQQQRSRKKGQVWKWIRCEDIRTNINCSSSNFPQHESKGPDIDSLVRLKAICLNGVIQDLRGHVALCPNFRVIPYIQLICVLKMHHSKTWRTKNVWPNVSLLHCTWSISSFAQHILITCPCLE